jgi:hypothetical protein
VPLIDTGALANAIDIQAADGSLVLTIGSTRAEIGLGHQTGAGHLPVRIHHAWNPEFVYTHPKGVAAQIAAHYKTEIQKIRHEMRNVI